MSRKVTIHDIARELNTTVSTVSRALNDHPAISTNTKTLVRDMAKKLNYSQNRLASSLRSGKTYNIGILIPSAELHFFGSVVHGIEKVLNENGYNILLYQSGEQYNQEVKGVQTFLQSQVDGIIASIAFETKNFDHFLEIKKQNKPLVFFDRSNSELKVPSVTIDDYKGGYIATEHLIKQGYRRIAHISAKQRIKIFEDRLRGYKDALKAYGIAVNEDLIAYGDVSLESGKECTALLLSKKPDAIFAVEDFTALGALQKLKESGVDVPGKIGIIGFANESFSQYVTPSLSTIEQQTIKMGEEAARLFLELADKEKRYASAPNTIVLDPILLARESSRRKKA
ncbi:substrate-binding domain-containing protein [Pedobacter sp. HMF7647]|uniref:Substrate-binding domain-containing protein n=1 Tax=Hufsiella arboris TaxID=2695275 RepID=A0A7K1Y4H6_9SPHI|nr:LacI family DNA-binding transcriptional regulator [Hufsiella arboris]MXV49475.1 substrate-binding domain-containing protein [Hufsiella arboris]